MGASFTLICASAILFVYSTVSITYSLPQDQVSTVSEDFSNYVPLRNITFHQNDASHQLTCTIFPEPSKFSRTQVTWDWFYQTDSNAEWLNLSIFPDVRINGPELEFPELKKTIEGVYYCAGKKPAHGLPFSVYDKTLQQKWIVTIEENDEPEPENTISTEETTENPSTSTDLADTSEVLESSSSTTTMRTEPSAPLGSKSKSTQLFPSSCYTLGAAIFLLIFRWP